MIDIHLTTNSDSHKTEFTQNIIQLLLTLPQYQRYDNYSKCILDV